MPTAAFASMVCLLLWFPGQAIEGQCTRLEDAKRRRNEHEKECFVHGGQKTTFPEDPCIKFKAIEKQVEAPFVVYADFEAILNPLNASSGEKTVKTEEHLPCSYSYLIVSRVPNLEFEKRIYVGLDAAEHFLASLQDDLKTNNMPVIERDIEMI